MDMTTRSKLPKKAKEKKDDARSVVDAIPTMRGPLDREWLAWRQVCKQLDKLGVSINDNMPLACAIRLWGEELVALREQNPEHTEKALAEKRNEYEPHVLDRWQP